MLVLQFEVDLVVFINMLDARCNFEPNAILCNSLVDKLNPIWKIGAASCYAFYVPLRDIKFV